MYASIDERCAVRQEAGNSVTSVDTVTQSHKLSLENKTGSFFSLASNSAPVSDVSNAEESRKAKGDCQDGCESELPLRGEETTDVGLLAEVDEADEDIWMEHFFPGEIFFPHFIIP